MRSLAQIGRVLGRARKLAVEYRRLTGKTLGLAGELGEHAAASRLGLVLAPARTAGYDATRKGKKYQIKTRTISRNQKIAGQRMGAIRLGDWDVVVLVLLDENLQPFAMYEASREKVKAAIGKTSSKNRARGALAITEFIRFGKLVWPARKAR